MERNQFYSRILHILFIPVYCELYQMAYKLVKLDRDFKINLNDFMQPNSGIIFPNPNAPTGLLVDLDFIETILKIT